jgi:hypothetical protein
MAMVARVRRARDACPSQAASYKRVTRAPGISAIIRVVRSPLAAVSCDRTPREKTTPANDMNVLPVPSLLIANVARREAVDGPPKRYQAGRFRRLRSSLRAPVDACSSRDDRRGTALLYSEKSTRSPGERAPGIALADLSIAAGKCDTRSDAEWNVAGGLQRLQRPRSPGDGELSPGQQWRVPGGFRTTDSRNAGDENSISRSPAQQCLQFQVPVLPWPGF